MRMTPDVLHEFLEYENFLEGIDTIYIYVQKKTSGSCADPESFVVEGVQL